MTTETVALVLADRHLLIPVIRSARRTRTLTISVDAIQGVRVMVPARTPRREIESLVARQSGWIERRLRNGPAESGAGAIPSALPYLGHCLPLRVEEGSRLAFAFDGDAFKLCLPTGAGPGAARTGIERFYRRETERLVNDAVARLALVVGRQPSRVLVRAQKRRWGSCAADGSLRFNLRLAMLAPEIIDYVVVHELCHLIRRDHSPAFWAEVARVLPGQRELRASLRAAERELPSW